MNHALLLVAAAVAGSSLGVFVQFFFFFTYGYTLSVILAGAAALSVSTSAVSTAHALLVSLHGLRLGAFIYSRRQKPEFKQRAGAIEEKPVPLLVRLLSWPVFALLYAAMTASAMAAAQEGDSWWPAVALMVAALVFEGTADCQKSAAKRKAPKDWVSKGLFGVCRAPAYLGEIAFWAASWAAGLRASISAGKLPLLSSCIGLAGILAVMLGATSRLKNEQNKRYGNEKRFQQYAKAVPMLLPIGLFRKRTW